LSGQEEEEEEKKDGKKKKNKNKIFVPHSPLLRSSSFNQLVLSLSVQSVRAKTKTRRVVLVVNVGVVVVVGGGFFVVLKC